MPTKNKQIILILSGQIATGKSTLAEKLAENYGFKVLSTRQALKDKALKEHGKKAEEDRKFLQEYGEKLDTETNGRWVCDHFQNEINSGAHVVIESARILSQIHAFRQAYEMLVVHVHLTAGDEILQERYLGREKAKGGSDSEEALKKKYVQYKKNETERKVEELAGAADLLISTEWKIADDVFVQVASFLRLLSPINNRLVDVVVGGQFGSEGKGQIVGYLAPEYDWLVRVGGPNAGHKVFSMGPDQTPSPDTFHIIPSGAKRNSKARIILGPGTVINEKTLLEEIQKFQIDDPKRLIIDKNAIIITQENIDYEKRNQKIGSTAQGVGHATAMNILDRLHGDKRNKAENNKMFKAYIGSAHETLEKVFANREKVLLEGTQGTFLSLHHGWYPYVTSRDTTVNGCLSESGIAPFRVRKVIMVVRTYPIRVQDPPDGTSGPFINRELSWDEIASRSGIPLDELLETEKTSTTGKRRRVGEFSFMGFRKACELNSPTDIALTFSDYIDKSNKQAFRYDQLTGKTTKFIEELERCSGVPVSLISTRFNYRSVIDRRTWA